MLKLRYLRNILCKNSSILRSRGQFTKLHTFPKQVASAEANLYNYFEYSHHHDRGENNGFKTTLTLGPLIGIIAMCQSVVSDKEKRLFRATQYGIVEQVQLLLDDNIDVNMRHQLGWTPLMLAVVNGHYEVVKLLLESGANPNLCEEFITPKRTAKDKGLHPIEVMLAREDEFSGSLNTKVSFQGFTALHYAVLMNNFDIVKLLIEKGADPIIENEAGHTALMYAKEGELKTYLQEQTSKFEEIKKEKDLEERRRFPLEERLKKHIVGQEGAITIVAAKAHSGEIPFSGTLRQHEKLNTSESDAEVFLPLPHTQLEKETKSMQRNPS